MAGRVRPVSTGRSPSPWMPAALAGGLLVLFPGFALMALAWRGLADAGAFAAAFDGYMARVAAFTLTQAAASTLLSLLPALMVARALHRHPAFAGRGLLLALLALPLSIPALVAALGLLALVGRNGLAAPVLSALTGERWPGIYGISGILIAHVFFNLPLASRFFLAALEAVPADVWRLSRQLGLGGFARFRLIEWPAMAAALPGAAVTVFLLCATSFTLVLVLGGGPQNATLEVALYQALRFDFAPPAAAAFAFVQAGLAGIVALAALRFRATASSPEATFSRGAQPMTGRAETAANAALIAAAALLVALPLAAMVLRGLSADLARFAADGAVIRATMTSLAVAAPAALLAVAASAALLSAPYAALAQAVERAGAMVFAVSPVVIGAGWFLLLHGRVTPRDAAPVILVAANAVMAAPFVLRMLAPGWRESRARHDRLAASLGLAGWRRFTLVEARLFSRPLAAAAALAATLSLGDLGVIALFGSDGLQTLPSLLLARLGSYRTDDAAGIALILAALCAVLLAASAAFLKERAS